MRTVTFSVPGIATPWARAGRKGGFSYTPGPQRAAMADIKVLAQRAMAGQPLLVGPVEMTVSSTFPWPKSMSIKRRGWPGYHFKDTRPDTSNFLKLIEDALIGVVYCDDGQIAKLHASKTYSETAEVTVTITQLRSLAHEIEAAA